MSLVEGNLLDDRYRVIHPLGEGGMGAAYLVEDERLTRPCVAKAAILEDESHHEQFAIEATMLANLDHRRLPDVYDYFFEDGQPYLVMQFIEGSTLDRRKEGRSAPFEVDQVLRWANDLLDALAYLHGQEPPIVHRDIKPPNVCITPEGRAVLLDFGIAKRLDKTSTHTGAQAHSLHYSPIEQYPAEAMASYGTLGEYLNELKDAGIHTGTYSDVYSLGATLYFGLTLLDPPDACMRFLGEQPRAIRELSPDAPDFLVDAVNEAMVLDPRDRCQDAFELQRLLQTQRPEPTSVGIRSREPRPLPNESVTALDHNLIYVAAGQFLMGSDDSRLKDACHPRHPVELGPYCIARCSVTNADYQRFVDNNPEYPVPYSPMRYAQRYNWDQEARTYPRGLEDRPVVLVTWQDARAYCRWLTEVTGYQCRLPSEAEWEKAARWDADAERALQYPWGDEFDEERCNVDAHGELRLESSPVGRFSPAGDSPYGLAEMAGNVWEWTGSLYRPYPYDLGDGREDPNAEGNRTVRGGAYDEGPLLARSAWRNSARPDLRLANIGFRVACDAE